MALTMQRIDSLRKIHEIEVAYDRSVASSFGDSSIDMASSDSDLFVPMGGRRQSIPSAEQMGGRLPYLARPIARESLAPLMSYGRGNVITGGGDDNDKGKRKRRKQQPKSSAKEIRERIERDREKRREKQEAAVNPDLEKRFPEVQDEDLKKEYDYMGRLPDSAEGRPQLSVLDAEGLSVVYEVEERETKKTYAMKQISPEMLLEDIGHEVDMQNLLASEHVPSIYKTFKRMRGNYSAGYVIMTDLCPDGELTQKIQEIGGLTDDLDVRETFRKIVEGVKFIHGKDVAHLDLKPSNIWFAGAEPKIGDFGMAQEAKGNAGDAKVKIREGSRFGSRAYIAFELLRQWVKNKEGFVNIDAKAVDIFALGVVLQEMITGTTPWKCSLNGMKEIDECLKLIDTKGIEGFNEVYTPLPSDADADARDLIQNMLQLDPSKRYTIEEVASHAYFSSI
jgi:tRNA A-37 threonylcarbamoyl transferase component Bud32